MTGDDQVDSAIEAAAELLRERCPGRGVIVLVAPPSGTYGAPAVAASIKPEYVAPILRLAAECFEEGTVAIPFETEGEN